MQELTRARLCLLEEVLSSGACNPCDSTSVRVETLVQLITLTKNAHACAQMTSTEEELLSLDFYARKTFFKTASLMANSCKAIALLGGQSAAVAQLAHDYGRHLGLAFQARCAMVSRGRS